MLVERGWRDTGFRGDLLSSASRVQSKPPPVVQVVVQDCVMTTSDVRARTANGHAIGAGNSRVTRTPPSLIVVPLHPTQRRSEAETAWVDRTAFGSPVPAVFAGPVSRHQILRSPLHRRLPEVRRDQRSIVVRYPRYDGFGRFVGHSYPSGSSSRWSTINSMIDAASSNRGPRRTTSHPSSQRMNPASASRGRWL